MISFTCPRLLQLDSPNRTRTHEPRPKCLNLCGSSLKADPVMRKPRIYLLFADLRSHLRAAFDAVRRSSWSSEVPTSQLSVVRLGLLGFEERCLGAALPNKRYNVERTVGLKTTHPVGAGSGKCGGLRAACWMENGATC